MKGARKSFLTLAFAAFLLAPIALPAAAKEDQYFSVEMRSSLLSQFWGQPIPVRANVLLPDSYYKDPQRRYPTLYVVHALGGRSSITLDDELNWQRPLRASGLELIIVFLDANFNKLHTLFADSANNGPWADALTKEFIPLTDAHFRTIADARARFLEGHSSGGWAALWLQVKYPQLFGGVWAIAPDYVDFHDYGGADITARGANVYHDGGGREYGVWRTAGRDTLTMRQFAYGPIGKWQFDLDDAAFSPPLNGRPQPMFDRRTGDVNTAVAQYWEANYDVTKAVSDEWAASGSLLRGKLHVYVGEADTFHLEAPVQLLDRRLQSLGAQAEIVYVPKADHWSVFDYDGGLIGRIVREIKASLDKSH